MSEITTSSGEPTAAIPEQPKEPTTAEEVLEYAKKLYLLVQPSYGSNTEKTDKKIMDLYKLITSDNGEYISVDSVLNTNVIEKIQLLVTDSDLRELVRWKPAPVPVVAPAKAPPPPPPPRRNREAVQAAEAARKAAAEAVAEARKNVDMRQVVEVTAQEFQALCKQINEPENFRNNLIELLKKASLNQNQSEEIGKLIANTESTVLNKLIQNADAQFLKTACSCLTAAQNKLGPDDAANKKIISLVLLSFTNALATLNQPVAPGKPGVFERFRNAFTTKPAAPAATPAATAAAAPATPVAAPPLPHRPAALTAAAVTTDAVETAGPPIITAASMAAASATLANISSKQREAQKNLATAGVAAAAAAQLKKGKEAEAAKTVPPKP